MPDLVMTIAVQKWWRTTNLLVLAGCAASPPAVESVQVAASVPTAAPRVDPAIVSVVIARAPAALVIDGDLGEWGPFPSPLPSLPPPVAYDDPKPTGEHAKVPNPSEAASHLAFALTDGSALVAAELGDAARDGIWLGVGFRPADLPLPGHYLGNLGYVPVGGEPYDCAQAPKRTADGEGYRIEANSPDAAAACKAVVARHAEQRAKYVSRFARLYRIDRDGVRGLSADGKLVAIAGARSALEPHGKGATMEVSLPLDALPRAAEAPLTSLRLVARAATSSEPPALEGWVWGTLPEAVSFEPYGALRAHAFKRALDYGVGGPAEMGMTSYRLPRGLSYQPGEPLRLEIVDSTDCTTLAARDVTLYKREASFGDVEVGYVAAPRGASCSAEFEPWVAVFVKSKLVSIEPSGSPRGTVIRGGELHVLSFTETRWSSVGGKWSVMAFAADGRRRAGVIESVPGLRDPGGKDPYWDNVSDFAGKGLDGFGWRGATGTRGLEVIWHWDEARKVYRGKQRSILPPKGPRR